MTEDWGTPEIVRALKRIEAKVDHINDGAVPRGEYEVKMRSLDREIVELKGKGREIIDKIESRQVPWTAIVSLVLAGLTAAILLIQSVST